jgi:phage shock protein A
MKLPFFRRKKAPAPAADPLAAYDALLDEVERQAADVRRAAATLLAARGELARAAERATREGEALEGRRAEAERLGEGRVAAVLVRDVEAARARAAQARQALARTERDGPLLLEAARRLAGEAEALRAERGGAVAQLAADRAVVGALRERVDRVSRALALDAARDEVERAHQLAEIYREEAGEGDGGRPPSATRERGG